MKKTRRRYDREFKISVVAELEAGKPLAQIAREHGIHPSLPSRWREELAENPERAFSGNGNRCKYEARNAELERLLDQVYTSSCAMSISTWQLSWTCPVESVSAGILAGVWEVRWP